MLESTLKCNEPLTYKQIVHIVDRAVEEGLKVLKEINPDIHMLKYEKGDDLWVLKDRLVLGMMLELMFMGLFNHEEGLP